MELIDMEKRKQSKHILFNGYVLEPISFAIFPALICIATLTLAIYATVDFHLVKKTYFVTEGILLFDEIESSGPVIQLYSKEGRFSVSKGLVDTGLLSDYINSHEMLSVRYRGEVGREGDFDILSMTNSDGQILISEEVAVAANSKRAARSETILWSVCIVCCTLTMGGYYILSNAPRYPRLAAILVRKGYRNF